MKQSLFTTMILASADAIALGWKNDPATITRYRSQYECSSLSSSPVYHYEFNQKACACFLRFDIPFSAPCTGDEVFNPFHTPYELDSLCISRAEYEAIFDHNLGDDCTGHGSNNLCE